MLLFTAIARDYETARQMAIANLSRRYNQSFEHLVYRYCALGTPARVPENSVIYRRSDVQSSIQLHLPCGPGDQQIEWCAAELMPHLRSP